MRTLDASKINQSDLAQVEAVTRKLPRSELSDALLALFEDVRSGEDVCLARLSEDISPAQAARLLGMSRAHIYKLLNSGEIPHVRVGRDRRIAASDLAAYKSRRDQQSKQLAEQFAHPSRVDAAARDAIEKLLD